MPCEQKLAYSFALVRCSEVLMVFNCVSTCCWNKATKPWIYLLRVFWISPGHWGYSFSYWGIGMWGYKVFYLRRTILRWILVDHWSWMEWCPLLSLFPFYVACVVPTLASDAMPLWWMVPITRLEPGCESWCVCRLPPCASSFMWVRGMNPTCIG